MHLKVRRDQPRTTDPATGALPVLGLLGWGFFFSIAPASSPSASSAEGRAGQGRAASGPAGSRSPAPPPPASPHLRRGCGSAQHQRTVPPPAAALRPGSAEPARRGPGWAAGGFRANLFKREAAEGLERQGSAFLRQSTGRNTHVAIPFSGGSSTNSPFDNLPPPPAPPTRPGLIYSPAILLNPGSAISSGHAPQGGDGELAGEDFPSEETRLLGCYEPAQ